MLVIETISDLSDQIANAKSLGRSIGFVPTMGALHPGHVHLVEKAAEVADIVVVSIFVNPTQFNNPNDLLKYPKTLEADCQLLEGKADIVFAPQVSEMYTRVESKSWDFGLLTSSLEGHYRPGHFDGVCTIVQKLLVLVRPDWAFFGKKDYQQLAVIQALVKAESLPVRIVPCDTVREADGLAMSSRNMRLSPQQRKDALLISQTLMLLVSKKEDLEVSAMVELGVSKFNSSSGLSLEYLAIVDATTFEPVLDKKQHPKAVILIAAFADDIRLIDNMELVW
jgi:pantoate--beta-alanine ligase